MKILFIENRYKTYFYTPVAKYLQQWGHEIFWLVQNKDFKPKEDFKSKTIKYPKSQQRKIYQSCDKIEDIIASDRQQNFFSNKDKSYFYYYNDEIKSYLSEIKPDVVFGESTAFHELITIKNCKELDILFLNPSTCRYPIGRFSFYKNNTLEPFSGSGELLCETEAETIIDQIIYRKTPPDYMKLAPNSKGAIIKDHIKKINSYAKGEIFNTPSPVVKYRIEKVKKQNIIKWNEKAFNGIEKGQVFNVLYPLQMQPEANIDVWGRKYRNQTEVVKSIARELPEDAVLYVKPNPKSKYELSSDLQKLVESHSNIKHLHHNTKMDDILPSIDLVITVTGTIAIECIFNNKPVVTLVKTINNTAKNCVFLEGINDTLNEVITKIKKNTFKTLVLKEKVNFINTLNETSFKGVISDPFTDVNCMSKSNINDLLKAFETVLTTIK